MAQLIEKKLTIAIPTYNRCNDLKNNLEVLLPQICVYSSKVDFIISDNCSSDNTEDFVNRLVLEHPDIIHYYRNSTNIGALGNFTQCVELTKTEYLCLLGDDDIVAFGFIASVLEILEKNDVDILHFNTLSYKESAKKIVPFYNKWDKNKIIKIYSSPTDFIKTTLDGPSFMSSLVFKKKIWIDGTNKYPETCYGYNWLMRIYAGLKDNSYCAFYSLPLVTRYVSDSEGYSRNAAKYYFIGLSRLFLNIDEKYPGVYKAWRTFQDNSLTSYTILLEILPYKENYKDVIIEMNTFFTKRRFKYLFSSVMYLPNSLVRWVIRPIVKLYVRVMVALIRLNIIKDKSII